MCTINIKAFASYRDSQTKLRKALAVIAACVLVGYAVAKWHIEADGGTMVQGTSHSFKCEDFWAWEGSPIFTDAASAINFRRRQDWQADASRRDGSRNGKI